MEPVKKKISLANVNLLFDIVIFTAFLLSLDPHATGHAIHEWLGIALIAAIVTHLLLHWKWIVQVTTRFFRKLSMQARLNYILNALFFVDFTILVFTGLMISETALPTLGIYIARDKSLRRLHTLSADLIVLIVGLHVAIHWKLIFNAIKRYILRPIAGLFKKAPPDLAAASEVKL
jgi:cytochrome b